MRVVADALRLAFGTLTILRVPAPRELDQARAGWAMAAAPAVGGLLAAACLALAAVAPEDLIGGFLTIGLLALLTRGLHLDGLADVADGLGAAISDPDRGLAVMRRGDVGPFGVVTMVAVLGLQATAIAQLLAAHAWAALVLGLVVSRLILPVLCLRGVPAARTDGLGPAVAGSVDAVTLVAGLLVSAATVTLLWLLVGLDPAQQFPEVGVVLAMVGSGLAVGTTFALHCIRRFGGITGDVLGACVELTFTAALVAGVVAR